MSHETGPDLPHEPKNALESLMHSMLGEEGFQKWLNKPAGEPMPTPGLEAMFEEKAEAYGVLSEHARHLLGRQGMRSDDELAMLVTERRTHSALETVVALRTWPIKFATPPEEGWSSAVLRVNEHFERISYDAPFEPSGRLRNIRVIVSAEDGMTTEDIYVREPLRDDFVSMDEELALTALQRMRAAIDS